MYIVCKILNLKEKKEGNGNRIKKKRKHNKNMVCVSFEWLELIPLALIAMYSFDVHNFATLFYIYFISF